MPNHVYNAVAFHGSRHPGGGNFNKLLDLLLGDNGEVDFNALVPTPYNLRAAAKADVLSPELHDWRVANWGTKWPAYQTEVCHDILHQDIQYIQFVTAWDTPKPIVEAICRLAGEHGIHITVHTFDAATYQYPDDDDCGEVPPLTKWPVVGESVI